MIRIPGIALAIPTFAAVLVFASSGRAAEFLRGDANSDGVVSIADAHFIESYAMRGGSPSSCIEAMNADGRWYSGINVTDGIYVLNYLFLGGDTPPMPFPQPGQGASPDTDCGAYDIVSALEDPAAAIEILDVTVTGGSEAKLKLTLALSNSTPVAGYSVELSFDPSVLWVPDQASRSTITDLSGTFQEGFKAILSVSGNRVRVGVLNAIMVPSVIPPGQSVAVGEFDACVIGGVKAGTYPLSLSACELVDAASARAIHAPSSQATLTVLSDVAQTTDCGATAECLAPPVYPDPLPPVNATYRLGSVVTRPGRDFEVPFSILADAETQAFGLSLDFDEEVLQASNVEVVFPDPATWVTDESHSGGFKSFDIDNNNVTPGNAGIDEGFIVGVAIFSFTDRCHNIPPGMDTTVLKFHMTAKPETEVNSTQLVFRGGAQGGGSPVENRVTAYGQNWTPETADSFVFVNGYVEVLPEISIFVRGDSNADQALDISDPTATLGYLFLGAEPPACYDASDANDDGEINVSDPIYTLIYLFAGGGALPPPFPGEGEDPTEDSMTCSRR